MCKQRPFEGVTQKLHIPSVYLLLGGTEGHASCTRSREHNVDC